jgi:hypothetical protein
MFIQIVKNILLFITSSFLAFISIFAIPIVLQAIQQNDWVIAAYLFLFSFFLSILIGLIWGIISVTIFLGGFNSNNWKVSRFFVIFVLPLGISCVVCLLLIIFK